MTSRRVDVGIFSPGPARPKLLSEIDKSLSSATVERSSSSRDLKTLLRSGEESGKLPPPSPSPSSRSGGGGSAIRRVAGSMLERSMSLKSLTQNSGKANTVVFAATTTAVTADAMPPLPTRSSSNSSCSSTSTRAEKRISWSYRFVLLDENTDIENWWESREIERLQKGLAEKDRPKTRVRECARYKPRYLLMLLDHKDIEEQTRR